MQISDKALKQAILFFGAVSFLLGKTALQGDDKPAQRPGPRPDPLLRSLELANRSPAGWGA